MSSIVCHNLVPCIEYQFTETPITVNLKAPEQEDFGMCDHLKSNTEFGKLRTTEGEFIHKEQSFYGAPFRKLSAKALELCTENLGSETGSDIVDGGRDISILPSNLAEKTFEKHRISSKESRDFPPPLTTMRGAKSLQLRRHTEGGRLIIEATLRKYYMQAERSDGRLRLCFLTYSEEEEENDDECNDEDVELEENEEEINLDKGKEKFQSLSRCMEGGHGCEGLCTNWKPALWVATS